MTKAPLSVTTVASNTNSRPVMNPPADEAEAGNRVYAAPHQADPDAVGRGVSGLTSGSEARPVTPTAQPIYCDPSRWFDALGDCCVCHKPATGIVRGDRNQSMGTFCRKCGEARIRKAEKERERHGQR